MSRLDEYIVTCPDMQKTALLTFAGCTANIGLRYTSLFSFVLVFFGHCLWAKEPPLSRPLLYLTSWLNKVNVFAGTSSVSLTF